MAVGDDAVTIEQAVVKEGNLNAVVVFIGFTTFFHKIVGESKLVVISIERITVGAGNVVAVKEYPAVFHCAAGADRTGTLAFLISGLLGVSRDDLTKDFELTSFSDFGLRCRGKLQSPYTYGLYQNDSNNYVNWGQLVLGVVNCGDSSLSLKERFRKFVSETYEISTEKFDALERIMLE